MTDTHYMPPMRPKTAAKRDKMDGELTATRIQIDLSDYCPSLLIQAGYFYLTSILQFTSAPIPI